MCAYSLSGCVDDSASDLGYYEPYIYARFSNINLSSLSDVLNQNGINHHYNINEVNDDQWDLSYIINKNSSYNISGNIINVFSPTYITFSHNVEKKKAWMDIMFWYYPKDPVNLSEYQFVNRSEAEDAQYLLNDGWNLTKALLNESNNPIPKIEYKMRW